MTPLALFIFNRPNHVRESISALKKCYCFDNVKIHVYADGPRNHREAEITSETRRIARALLGSDATYIESDVNLGLSSSITRGVTELCARYGRVIVLEDDLIVSKNFLRYMNEALDRYDGYQSIMQISGYMFPIKSKSISAECSFLPLTTSWGWATWKRAWSNYDPEARGWESLLSNPKEKSRFNFVDSFDFLGMLKKQFNGEIDSWAIRWYWSVFINHGLVLYPPTSMVRNDGFDGSGTHGWRTYAHALTHEYLDEPPCVNYPNGIVIDQEQMESVQKYFKTHGSTPRARIKRVLEKLRIFR